MSTPSVTRVGIKDSGGQELDINATGAAEVELTSAGTAYDARQIRPLQAGVDSATVDVTSSALPTGAATEATLATRASEATLATRASETTLATRASETTLAGAAASLTSIDGKLASPLPVTGPLTDTELRASAVPTSNAADSQTDGHSASIGSTGDADTANTVIGRLKQIVTRLSNALTADVTDRAARLLGIVHGSVGQLLQAADGRLDQHLGAYRVTEDTGNSSTTPLGVGSAFTGTGFDTNGYSVVRIFLETDEDGDLYVEWSTDNTNWGLPDLYPGVVAGVDTAISPKARYVRVRLVNGATPQTVLRLAVTHTTAPYRLATFPDNSANSMVKLPTLVALSGSIAPGWSETCQVPLSVDLLGNLRTRTDAWLGSTAPTVGPKTSANSIPVVPPSDYYEPAAANLSVNTSLTASSSSQQAFASNSNALWRLISNRGGTTAYYNFGASNATASDHPLPVGRSVYIGRRDWTGAIQIISDATASGTIKVTEATL